ncbi:MAG TPA: RcpC/CpaB family pilus assembly protein [Sinomonas sp.]|nr:RcpC/CpaB family pilus assembly protein [Sinomonas sp.]
MSPSASRAPRLAPYRQRGDEPRKGKWAAPERPRLRRFFERRRRTLAAALLCAAVAAGVYQLTPPTATLSIVVIAAADLPAGSTLSAGQLRMARLPADSVPDHAATSLDAVLGQRLAGPLRRGEVLTDTATMGPGLLAGAAPGTVAVPVRVADPDSLQLIRTGQTIDLVLSEDGPSGGTKAAAVLASAVTVLWTEDAKNDRGSWLGQGQGGAGLVVVATSSERAPALAGASTRGKVFFTLTDKR